MGSVSVSYVVSVSLRFVVNHTAMSNVMQAETMSRVVPMSRLRINFGFSYENYVIREIGFQT